MSVERIVIVGGGSAYVPGILYSFAHIGEALRGSQVVLTDVDPTRLPMMTRLGQRMAAEARSDISVSSAASLDEALEGATFVLTNFRPGGLEGLRLDEEIPARYGVIGQETTGPGGTFFALRSIPQVLDLCAHMERICPDAWMINYVNPTNFVADAIHRRSKLKSVAICDGGGNGLRFDLPELLSVPREQVLARAAGVNHHTWLLELQVAGKDGYGLLRERLEARAKQNDGRHHRDLTFSLWALDTYGVFPANAGYLLPYFEYDEALAEARTGHSLYRMFMRDLPVHWPNFQAMAEGKAPVHMDTSKHHTDVGHGDLAVEIIVAIATNDTREFHVNIPNEGSVTNLPRGATVEVPALVNAGGVKPLCMGELPKGVLGLTQTLIAWEELSVDAALTGDRRVLLQALQAHPWVRSTAKAKQMCDEMLEAHAAWLPQFKA